MYMTEKVQMCKSLCVTRSILLHAINNMHAYTYLVDKHGFFPHQYFHSCRALGIDLLTAAASY